MNRRWLLVMGLVAACGPSAKPCGPSTCSGCCDASGACRQTGSSSACGVGGALCQQCSGSASCAAGVCTSFGAGGGSAGGSAGGTVGGGNAAGGAAPGGGAAGGNAAGGAVAGGSAAGGSAAGGSAAGGNTAGGSAVFDSGVVDSGVRDAGVGRDGGCTLSFGPLRTQTGGGVFMATGDYDHDGRPDLAWSNPFGNEVAVSLNSATGLRPAVRTPFSNNSWPAALASADVDLDGFDDLVVGAFFANELVFVRNDQQGRFAITTRYQVPNVWAVNAAPLDNVLGSDFVVANELQDVLVLRNVNGALALPNPWATDAGLQVRGNCVGDLRSIGVNDLVALSGLGPGVLTVLRNDGNARFSIVDQLSTISRPLTCTIGDFDGDGRADLVVTTIDATVELFRQTSGRLQFLASLPGLKSEAPAALKDLDFDGVPELVIPNSVGDGGVYVVRAFSDGGLLGPTRLMPSPNAAAALLIVDIDGDGLDDVVGSGGGQTFVMPNTCH
ncbi:MAG: VCBS repeat-containing protein [Archangium sp.]|nr:VCBS repeat-containing protein [Archangium sp.]